MVYPLRKRRKLTKIVKSDEADSEVKKIDDSGSDSDPPTPPTPRTPHLPRLDTSSEPDAESESESEDEEEVVSWEVDCLEDLIALGRSYDPNTRKRKKYSIDLPKLHGLVEPLEELNSMIGMGSVKESILNMLRFHLQDLDEGERNMMHTVIEGSPGCGKTELGRILCKIYMKMGITKRNYFRVVKRSDLIAGYLGQTALKTQKVIDSCAGGVLFIDEAYSLGDSEQRDSYSSECINILNQNLSENKGRFVCIIAGYHDQLQRNFFATNPGLERRFPFCYTIEPYTAEELRLIFLKKVADEKWGVGGKDNEVGGKDNEVGGKDNETESVPVSFFAENMKYFKDYGGDMETLFQMTKITHARRVFTLPRDQKKRITYEDLQGGMERFLQNENYRKRGEDTHTCAVDMYI